MELKDPKFCNHVNCNKDTEITIKLGDTIANYCKKHGNEIYNKIKGVKDKKKWRY